MVLPFTLQQLRIFKAIASEKSFTQAAEILFVSQPSISKLMGFDSCPVVYCSHKHG